MLDVYEQFHALAVSFYSIPLFPLLYIVHCTNAALNVRKELGNYIKCEISTTARPYNHCYMYKVVSIVILLY